ncbi:MAG: TrmB family transcriptional regulator [Actinobacteria bacterium]|nr:TrmB family transcriptional regulator [Actinomycetota bacterium]
MGFSQYESRAYVALLQHSPVTGYELSKRSGVPRSMIYEVLGKLIDRGAAYTVPAEPVKYAPVPARELIERLRRNTERTLDYLENALGSLERAPEVDVIWHVRGHDRVLEEILSVVERAQRELWLSVWAAQISILADPVRRAQERGARVFAVLFDAPSVQLGLTFHHDYMPPEVVKARMGGHLTIATRDGEEVVIAEFTETAPPWAVKTRDPALILVANEFVRHDIMIDVIMREFGPERLDALWRDNPDLIHVVIGRRQ